MTQDTFSTIQRREFLKAAGAATVFSMTHTGFAEAGGRVYLLIDARDAVASGAAVKRAAERLQKALTGKGVKCEVVQSAEETKGSARCVVVATEGSVFTKGFPKAADRKS